MNPKQFLLIGGIVLVVVGLAGFFGIVGPDAASSIFGNAWWFDNAENWAHLVIGVVALIAMYTISTGAQRSLVIVVGIVAVLVGLYNFVSPTLLGANLESPADLLLHLVVGAWALWAAFGKGGKMGAMA